jgi:hypothetical protein
MTVVLNGVVNAQSIFPRVGMLGEFKQKSSVGSWEETFTFLDGPRKGEMGTALINYNNDGTMVGSEAGSITFDPPPKHQKDSQTGLVQRISCFQSTAMPRKCPLDAPIALEPLWNQLIQRTSG